jgi:AcrR family transcriptional regulator
MARPRSEEARTAALDAALALLVDRGFEAVTFDEVAARSGVAKTTLYRHFASKQAMVVEAARGCHVELATPDTGDLERDLRELLARATDVQEARGVPGVMLAVLAASQRDPELRELLVGMLEELRRPLRTVLRLAQARGEIGAGVDLDVALALVIGPFTQRRLVDQRPIDDAFADAVVAHTVAALRTS